MAELNSKAQKVFALKYSTGKTKTWKDKCRRNADHIASTEKNFGKSEDEINRIAEKFYFYLYDLYMLPGGRIIANTDTGIKNLANCFVLDIQDSRQSIYQTLKDAAEVFADGGGLGYNFSHIREEGADIKTTGGQASGPLSFMTLFDQTGEVISQASRRGAQIAVLDVNHPDLEHFINFKSTLNSRNKRLMQEYDRNLHVVNGYLNGTKFADILEKTLLDDQLTHFNISVMVTDEFMECVSKNRNWDLVSPYDNKVKKTLKAKDLLIKMAERIHSSGDPGILNHSRINLDNLVPYIGDIEATNPCGEVPLLSGESCILTSINLHQVYNKKNHCVDYDLLKDIVKTSVRFLDNVTEISEAPIEKINFMTKGLRRISLGVLGFADLLVDLDMPYDSSEAVELSKYLSWFIAFHGWETSFELAKERGAFPFYEKEKCNFYVIDKVLYGSQYEQSKININELREIGVRNVAVTGLPPTGSIAIIGGVNSSIEPFFLLCYKRNITEGIGNIAKDYLIEINPALEYKLKSRGYSKEQIDEIINYVLENGSLENCDLVSEEFRNIFKTANEINWQWHIDIQSAWNEYVSNAISKTINVSENATIEDIYNILLYAYEKKLKGVTIFRDKSKSFQILEKPKPDANQ